MTTPFAPLDGVLVIDLSRALAGPHAAMLLGDLGARVIKVEAPGAGDDSRSWGPPFMQPDVGQRESTYFLSCNRNKDSISLDLKTEPDVATLAELIRRADVLVENFRGTAWTVGGEVGRAQGNRHPSIAPYGAFRCADGIVQIACGNETMWRRLCAQFGLDADDPDYATNISRLEHSDALTEQLERCFAKLDRDAVLAQLTEAGVPAGRIRGIDEVYEWEQTRSQRLLLDVEHESLGSLTLPGMPLRTFEMSAAGELSESTRREHRAPPVLNGDGPAIRSWLQ